MSKRRIWNISRNRQWTMLKWKPKMRPTRISRKVRQRGQVEERLRGFMDADEDGANTIHEGRYGVREFDTSDARIAYDETVHYKSTSLLTGW